MNSRRSIWFLLGVMAVALTGGCANFRKLGKDLDLIDNTYVVSAQMRNASQFPNVYGVIIEWENGGSGKVLSADFSKVGQVGVFGFLVERSANQYLLAFSDENGNEKYEPGEAAWIHADAAGRPLPIVFDVDEGRKSRSFGQLSRSVTLPADMIAAAREFRGARTSAEAASGMNIPVALGDIAVPDDPKFDATKGQEGLWQPASFPLKLGIGIYFLENYDPSRTPVLFVYGAAGSPQDWKPFFQKLDRSKYQAWFYFYPTGARLDNAGDVLNRGVKLLQGHFGFERLHVVAHSMGGLVSRSFVIKNVLEDGNRYIDKFVTISTPWNGHEAAEMGVKMAPKVVPSWYDMATDSPFQKDLFSKRLSGSVDHLLLHGHKNPKSRKPLPHDTDGTVSVASMTYGAAVDDAVEVIAYDEDHVSILSNPDVIARTQAFLAAPPSGKRLGERLGDRIKRFDPIFD